MKTKLSTFLLGLSLCLSAQTNFELLSNVTFATDATDVWGYTAPDGRMYAIVGTESGVAFVDLTNPRLPETIAFLGGPISSWRDIKTWNDHAYVVNETGGGLAIFPLFALPDQTIKYTWTGTAGFSFSTAHNLWIDENGYGYLAGTDSDAVEIIDLSPDPKDPEYVALAEGEYAHDVHVRGDKMYTFHIYKGHFGVYDVSDRTAPFLLATQATPFNFTHSGWPSGDGQTLFTCDEKAHSPTAAFDVSDLSDIKKLDTFKPPYRRGIESIPHNPFVINDFLLLSHYVDGCFMVDAHRPGNLVQVGHFDTYIYGCEKSYRGAWGIYAFPDGGPVLVSDRSTGLYILQPNYVRASYLEGKVTDAETGLPLFGAEVEIQSEEHGRGVTGLLGIFKTGQATPGVFEVKIRQPGYFEKTLSVTLATAEVTELEVELVPFAYPTSGRVVDMESGEALPGVAILIENNGAEFSDTTDSRGHFDFPPNMEGNFVAHAGKWGWQLASVFPAENFAGGEMTIQMEKGYGDNFEFDMGWEVSGDAERGHWVWGLPVDSTNKCRWYAPTEDSPTDIGGKCVVTGNSSIHFPTDFSDGNLMFEQVEKGETRLTSPSMALESEYTEPQLSYSTWFMTDTFYYHIYNLNTYSPHFVLVPAPEINDTLFVYLDNGREQVLLEALTEPHEWRRSPVFDLKEIIEITDEMRIIFRTADQAETPNIVEAAIDHLTITEGFGESALTEGDENVKIRAYPNPFRQHLKVDYAVQKDFEKLKMEVYDVLGRLVWEMPLARAIGTVELLPGEVAGVYFVAFRVDGKLSEAIRVVKGF